MNASRTNNERAATSAARGQVVSASGAARLLKIGRSTIQRRLADGSLPSAVKGTDGWEIPVEELLSAKIGPSPGRAGRTAASERRGALARPACCQAVCNPHPLDHELRASRLHAEVELVRRAAAEQLATERAQHSDYLRAVIDVLLAHRPPASRGM
ncbi:hypothetical protein FNU77_08680 [Prescottella equi]|uniref:hypothetical protein n=1 Tax=Rhodococcus hoagii TaxID=43767 RepID=UPI001165C6D4|nr:hypothetical protein [Prescottella equi]QDP09784.1 hypothetical protein FNU77_08680 [Prescottella equi]